jgi:hypothetical protein
LGKNGKKIKERLYYQISRKNRCTALNKFIIFELLGPGSQQPNYKREGRRHRMNKLVGIFSPHPTKRSDNHAFLIFY